MLSEWTTPDILPDLTGVKQIAVDVETCDPTLKTKGLGPRGGGFIAGLAVGTDDGRRWYFPVRHEGGGNMDEAMVREWAHETLNAFTGSVVGAKLDYDLDYLAEWGVTFPNVNGFDDVQIAEPLIDEWRREYNLNALAETYLNEGKDEALLREAAAARGWKDNAAKANLWRLPAHMVGPYAEADVDLPLRIFPLQKLVLEKEDLMEVYGVERKLLPILVAMRRRGVRVDIGRAEQVRGELIVRRDACIARMRALSSPKAELMIPSSFATELEARGVVIPKTAKTKKPSVTKDLFDKYPGDDLVAAIAEGRKLNTIINTFIDGHILGHNVNGRVHCEWKQLKDDGGGTIARIAATNPNLANIPSRDEEIGPLIRGIFLPEAGEQWQRDDMSQIEYRILAHFGKKHLPDSENAAAVCDAYNSDPKTDFHKLVAGMVGIDPEDKVGRKRVKNINFAKGYGAQAPRLASLMKCSVDEAKNFIARYDAALPFSAELFQVAQRGAEKKGYVRTLLRRRQRFMLWVQTNGPWGQKPLREDEAVAAWCGPNDTPLVRRLKIKRYMTYAALNRIMQGSNADILKKAMVDAHDAGITAALGPPLVTVYDELGSSVPRTKIGDEAGRELVRVMERAVKLSVPVLVESERGDNWGACK